MLHATLHHVYLGAMSARLDAGGGGGGRLRPDTLLEDIVCTSSCDALYCESSVTDRLSSDGA